MESSGMTTLQREVLVLVLLIASLATAIAVLLVILWATWYVYLCEHILLALLTGVRQAEALLPVLHQRFWLAYRHRLCHG